jgi:hypothetical protein
MRKGIGPNNLGAGPAGCPTCGPACDCDQPQSMAKFNPALEQAAEDGKLNPGFAKAVRENKKQPKAPGKILPIIAGAVASKVAGKAADKLMG